MKISIVTPSYNSSRYIRETIQSVHEQSYRNFEHIVVDGQSTDQTVKILAQYPHLRWISEPDRGQSDAINKGLRMATGEILAWQNADDLYMPYTFKTVVDFFRANPEVDIIYGNYAVIDERGQELFRIEVPRWNRWLFAHGRFVPLQPTVFWRRRVSDTIGELDLNLHYCMDVDFFARASKQFTFAAIPVLLGKFRSHDTSKTQSGRHTQDVLKEYKAVLSRHYNYGVVDGLLFNLFQTRAGLARKVLDKLARRRQ